MGELGRAWSEVLLAWGARWAWQVLLLVGLGVGLGVGYCWWLR